MTDLCAHDPAYAEFVDACISDGLKKHCGDGPYSVGDVVRAAVLGDSIAFRLLPPVRVGTADDETGSPGEREKQTN